MHLRKKIKSGFTIIEALIFLFIFTVTVVTFYKSFTFGITSILESKNRLAATQVANEKMEIVRALNYTSIGSKRPDGLGGWTYNIPSGDILEDEDVARNTRSFHVRTFIKYVDDPFDGLVSSTPADAVPNDYKVVKIQVSWDPGNSDAKSVFAVSTFVPSGVEAMGEGGLVYVNVTDSNNGYVPAASVRLANALTSTDTTYPTDGVGSTLFPEVSEDLSGQYRLIVSKAGYFTVKTYPPYDSSVVGSFIPINSDITVQNGTMTDKPITLDKLASLNISTRDMLGSVIPNISFDLEGGLKLGEDPVALKSVYSYSESLDSGADGSVDITDPSGISSGMYTFTPTSFVGYEFVKMDTATSLANNFALSPDVSLTETAMFADINVNSLLASIEDDVTLLPISGATINLKNVTLGYDQMLETDSFGKAYFPQDINPMIADTYEIIVTATGYDNFTDTVTIDKLTKKEIKLTASN